MSFGYHEHKRVAVHGDQMNCKDCGRWWDANDPDPPQCPATYVAEKMRGYRIALICWLLLLVGILLVTGGLLWNPG